MDMDDEMKNLVVIENATVKFRTAACEGADTRYEIEGYRPIISNYWTIVVKSPTIAACELGHSFTNAYLKEIVGLYSKTDAYFIGLLIEEMTGLEYLDKEDFER